MWSSAPTLSAWQPMQEISATFDWNCVLPELWHTEHRMMPPSPPLLGSVRLAPTGYSTSVHAIPIASPVVDDEWTAWTRFASGSAWLPDRSWQEMHSSVLKTTLCRVSWNGAVPVPWQSTQASPEIFFCAVAVPIWIVVNAFESVT